MRLLERSASLPVRADGGIRLVVVADTHSRPHADAARLVAGFAPDAILHAGDIGELDVLDAFAAIAPLHAVRGNIDVRARDLPDVCTLDVRDGERSLFTLLLTHIAVSGPRLLPQPARLARERGAQLVVCGHSHVPFIGRDRGLLVFNAGSVGPRRFQLPIVFGVLEWRGGKLDMFHVDAETGQRWEPGPVPAPSPRPAG